MFDLRPRSFQKQADCGSFEALFSSCQSAACPPWFAFLQRTMLQNRYSVVVADRSSGVVRRFTVRLRSAVGLAVLLLGTPMALGLGFRWTTSAEIDRLRMGVAALEVENAGYRAASTQLAAEIASLQTVVADLDHRAVLDPVSLEALNQLPPELKVRAIGGGAEAVAPNPLYTVALTSPRSTFTLLRDLLADLGGRLQGIRYGVERRRALAAATPAIWPTRGWLTGVYGYRQDPFTGIRTFHRALDISANRGAPVFATAAGRVEVASRSGNLGNLVVIEHGFGLRTRYGHLSRFAVRTGERVERGDVLGYVGSTGRATGAHVHYEIWVDGRAINPYRFLSPSEALATN